ncbi:MAG: hypothetical protein ABIF40_01315 [archaeon]
MRGILPKLGYILLIIMLVMAFTGGLWMNYTELVGNKDIVYFSTANRFFTNAAFDEFGERPLWNPNIFGGQPLMSNVLTGQFFPVNLFFMHFYEDYYMNFVYIFHMIIAGLLMFWFSKKLKLSNFASSVSAIVYIFSWNFTLLFQAEPAPIVVCSLIPGIFLAAQYLFEKKKLVYALILGSVLALQFLAGHVQYFFYSMLALGLFLIYHFYLEWKDNTPQKCLNVLGLFAIAIIFFITLSAVQLLPLAEFSSFSEGRGPNADLSFAAQESLPYQHLVNLILPEFFGSRFTDTYWGTPSNMFHFYMGILPLILASLAVLFSKRKYKWFFATLALLALLFSLGKYFVVFPMLYYLLPGIDFFKVPARMLIIFTFSMSILAGMGASYVMSKIYNARQYTKFIKILFILSVLTLIGALILAYNKEYILFLGERLLNHFYYVKYADTLLVQSNTFEYFLGKLELVYSQIFNSVSIFLFLFTLSTIILGLRMKNLNRNILKFAIIGLIILDLLILVPFYPCWDIMRQGGFAGQTTEEILSPTIEFDFLLEDESMFRIHEYAVHPIIPSYLATRVGLQTIRGSESLKLQYFGEVLNELIDDYTTDYNAKILGLLNVKYIFFKENIEQEGLTFVESFEHTYYYYTDEQPELGYSYVYENDLLMPRGFIVSDAKVITNAEEIKEELKEFDPKEYVILEEDFEYLDNDALYKEAVITYYSPNKVIVNVNMDSPGFLVLGDTWYPGWEAYDNGKETRIFKTNYVQRSVYLGEGEHEVEFVFNPLSYKIGFLLTFLSLLVLLIYLGSLAIM